MMRDEVEERRILGIFYGHQFSWRGQWWGEGRVVLSTEKNMKLAQQGSHSLCSHQG